MVYSKNSLKNYLSAPASAWYWVTVALSIVTIILIFLAPDFFPLSLISTITGATFIVFLPGFVVVKLLFSWKSSLKSSDYISLIERIAFSMALSIVFVAILTLLLSYLPWTIGLIPVTLTLFVFIIVMATAAVINESNYSQRKISIEQ